MVMSLDGYIAGPNGELDWENQDAEIGRFMIEDLLKTVDSMIIGRVLYQGFLQYWPNVAKDNKNPAELVDFAKWLDNCPKYVVSKSLEKADWNNSTVINAQTDEELVNKVNKLKESEGGDIVVFGGVRLTQSLVRLGLVDEYRFKIQPVALGKGQPLFTENRTPLKLLSTKIFNSGVVASYYKPL